MCPEWDPRAPGSEGLEGVGAITAGLCRDGSGGWCDAAVLSRTVEMLLDVGRRIPLGHGRRWMKMEGTGSPNPLALLPSQQTGLGAAPIAPFTLPFLRLQLEHPEFRGGHS